MYEQLFKHQEEIFKVIANQKRLEIIQLLTHGRLSVNEMSSMLGISQSNVSQHLKLLRQTGVLQARKDGTSVYYSLSDPKIAEACSLIRQFLIEHGGLDNDELLQSPDHLYPLVQDVVCGMRMAPSEIAEKTSREGQAWYFCAAGCKERFQQQPSRYMDKATVTEA